MSRDSFDALMASADPAVVVVTTAAEGVRAGCLVGFHSQSSMAPQQYCLWLSKANHTYRVGLSAEHFAVHFLTEDDQELAERFGSRTGEETDKFAGLEVDVDGYGVPLIRACPHRFVLERLTLLDDGGDHVCLTGRVRTASTDGGFAPLRMSDVAHLTPGRASDDRAVHP
jgi:flavin reductase (DIM6/NTAB) family NADH-FMN oxidoreductase RutF